MPSNSCIENFHTEIFRTAIEDLNNLRCSHLRHQWYEWAGFEFVLLFFEIEQLSLMIRSAPIHSRHYSKI